MGLSKIIQQLKDSFKPVPFDASIFKHPLAQKTGWTPVASGGANFKTQTLKKVSSSEIRFRGSTMSIFFSCFFILFPIIIWVFFLSDSNEIFNLGSFNPVALVPILFVVVAATMLYYFARPMVLDKSLGYFYKSYKKPVLGLDITPNPKWVKLNEVVALQIIPERVRSKNSSYTSYELNFVFEDGNRFNVIDYAKLSAVQSDGQDIADFLRIPLWDRTTLETYITPTISSTTSSVNSYIDFNPAYDEPFIENSDASLNEDYDSLKRREL